MCFLKFEYQNSLIVLILLGNFMTQAANNKSPVKLAPNSGWELRHLCLSQIKANKADDKSQKQKIHLIAARTKPMRMPKIKISNGELDQSMAYWFVPVLPTMRRESVFSFEINPSIITPRTRRPSYKPKLPVVLEPIDYRYQKSKK